jgi:hypothetical protein
VAGNLWLGSSEKKSLSSLDQKTIDPFIIEGSQMPTRDYRDLIAWKKAFELALAIYEITSNFPNDERYGITSQLRKAGVSIPSNIAEGQGRNSKGEFLHHLYIAPGSLK